MQVEEAAPPSESMPGARDAAKALIAQYGARAVVWITSNTDGSALWIYDGAGDRVVVRRLRQAPPFDEPAAASVALSIKTLLMHSEAAPIKERFGAVTKEASIQVTPPVWSLEVGGWARHSSAGDDSTELRVHLGLARHLGMVDAALEIQLGPGRSVQTDTFISGHFSDLAIALQARYPISLRRSQLTPVVGATLHFTKLLGTLSESSALVEEERVNPTLDVGLRWTLTTGAVMWGVAAQSSYFVRRQRYLVRGSPVLELPELDIQVGVNVALPFL